MPLLDQRGYDNSTITKAKKAKTGTKKNDDGKKKSKKKKTSSYDDGDLYKKKSSKKKRASMDDTLLKKSKKKGRAPPPPGSLRDSRALNKGRNLANVRNQYTNPSDVRAQARKEIKTNSVLLQNITVKDRGWYGGGDATRIFDMDSTIHMLRAKEFYSKPPTDESEFQAAIKAFRKKKYNRENYSLKPMGGLGPDMKCDRFRQEQSRLLQRQLAGEKFTLFNKPKIARRLQPDEEAELEAQREEEERRKEEEREANEAAAAAIALELKRHAEEQAEAATKIQKSFRGHLGRKKADKKKVEVQSAKKGKTGLLTRLFTRRAL